MPAVSDLTGLEWVSINVPHSELQAQVKTQKMKLRGGVQYMNLILQAQKVAVAAIILASMIAASYMLHALHIHLHVVKALVLFLQPCCNVESWRETGHNTVCKHTALPPDGNNRRHRR